MKLDEMPSRPHGAELIETEARESRGADLLGLRVPAEAVAVQLHDGVTTVTPSIRYLGLRAWCIHRYLERAGPNDRHTFVAFAGKVEAAVAYGGVLTGGGGVVGRNVAANVVSTTPGELPLRKLVQTAAVSLYTGPSEALGLGAPRARVPTLTPGRGLPLAVAVDDLVGDDEVLAVIAATPDEQWAARDALAALGRRFPMDRPTGRERQLLVEAVFPPNARGAEVRRVASYCLLLHLAAELRRPPTDADVFATASAPSFDHVPPELHEACDGWTRFLVRDLLVFVHEAAVAQVVEHLFAAGTPDGRRPSRSVVAELTDAGLDEGLAAVGLTGVSVDRPASGLAHALAEAAGPAVELRGLRRWAGTPNELALLRLRGLMSRPAGLALLPVAWALAARRVEPGITAGLPSFDVGRGAGASRMGMAAVVLPEVRSWGADGTSIRAVTARLVRRSVDQHLRIAWTRLAREPGKDVSLLQSDGEDWIYLKHFSPGRATSRVDHAMGWLRQLRLVDEHGLTGDGAGVLKSRLDFLGRQLGFRT